MLTRYWSPQKDTYKKGSTVNGKVSLEDAEYNCYTAKINDPNYRTSSKKFCLQAATIDLEMTLVKHSKTSDYTLILDASTNKNIDYDLALSIEGLPDSKGNVSSCIVTAYNKYCAYARHLNDVSTKNGGTEIIEINNFSVAYYMSWVMPSVNYVGTCNNAKLLNPSSKTKFITRRNLLLDDLSDNNANKTCEKIQANGHSSWYCRKQELKMSGNGSAPVSRLGMKKSLVQSYKKTIRNSIE